MWRILLPRALFPEKNKRVAKSGFRYSKLYQWLQTLCFRTTLRLSSIEQELVTVSKSQKVLDYIEVAVVSSYV